MATRGTKLRRMANRSSPINCRITIRALRAQRDSIMMATPLYVKILALDPPSDQDVHEVGEFDVEDFDIGDVVTDPGQRRLRNRRSVTFGDNTGAMRGWYYIEPRFKVGDSIKLMNYGIRLLRIVVSRNSRELFNADTPVPAHVVTDGQAMHNTRAFPPMNLHSIRSTGTFARVSIDNVKIKSIGELRTPEVKGEYKAVVELLVEDDTDTLWCSMWQKTASIPLSINQKISFRDIIAKKNNFHKMTTVNVNFNDEVTLGEVEQERIIGNVTGVEELKIEADEDPSFEINVISEKVDFTLSISQTVFRETFEMEELTVEDIQQSLPLSTRITLDLNGNIDTIHAA